MNNTDIKSRINDIHFNNIACKLECHGINAINYNTNEAISILSNCVLATKLINLLIENEQEIKNRLIAKMIKLPANLQLKINI